MAGTRTSIARRYAEAAFEIAQRDGVVDTWLEQLGTVAYAVSDSTIVYRLENPHVALETRTAALHKVLGADMLPQLGNLVGLLLRRRRVDALPSIAREFRRLYNRRAGIVEALATSAIELDDTELAALRTRLEKMTGGTIELATAVDPTILGGIQVRIGDTLYDGSVRGRLERLRAKLASGAITA
ncbi:MAG TPA: F0F1 ATP synthase subunit delta [Candidatus Limnocylindria bacterium]|nr:F0F1 ATP synthase subunit delta [Candidatus Limnocylindria bacterium]